jgi:hypothetical protein
VSPDSTQFDFVTGSCEPFTGHSAAVVANATTGNETATNTPTRKWTKWITAREPVVKVPYLRTTDEKLLHSLTSIRQLGNQLRVCAKNKKCRTGHGNLSKMYALGSRVYTTDGVTNLIQYSCNAVVADTALPNAVSALHDVGIAKRLSSGNKLLFGAAL